MSKRIKRVFQSADQVLHLWANQTQYDARCSNVFFEGTDVYSYGHHYLLGRIHKINGQTLAVINSTKYSSTTAKHQSYASSAVAHFPRLWSSDPTKPAVGLLEEQDRIISKMFDFFNGIKFYPGHEVGEYELMTEAIANFNRCCEILKKPKMKIEVPADFGDLMREHVAYRLARAAEQQTPEALAKKELQRQKRETAFRAKHAAQIQSWKSGGPFTEAVRALSPQIIRVSNGEIQTSRGAVVPMAEAKRLLVKILNHCDVTGEFIGGFKVGEIRGKLVTIGCHVISLDDALPILSA